MGLLRMVLGLLRVIEEGIMKKLKSPESPWLNLIEAQRYLKVSKETIYRYVYRKKIPMYRLGKLYRFNKGELDSWMKSKQVKGIK